MKDLAQLRRLTTLAAAIALASGTVFAQPPEIRSEVSQQRSDVGAAGVDDAEELHDNPDVETGDEEGMVADGQHSDHLHWSQGTLPQNGFHSDELVGSEVFSRDNELVGEVVDLILDEEDLVLGVFVEVGEVMGLGSRKVAIPWHALQPVRNGDQEFHLVVDIDRASLTVASEQERD